jgi:hypothetical protein
MDDKDVLWGMYQEHCTQARHHETMRATMSNLMLALSGGILGLVSFKELSRDTWPITLFLAFLGSFGAVFSAKHYERFRFHTTAAAEFRYKLQTLLSGTDLGAIRKLAGERHREKHPLIGRIRLHYFWNGLHAAIAVLGVILTFVVLSR